MALKQWPSLQTTKSDFDCFLELSRTPRLNRNLIASRTHCFRLKGFCVGYEMQGSHACLSTVLCAGVSTGRVTGRPFKTIVPCCLSPALMRQLYQPLCCLQQCGRLQRSTNKCGLCSGWSYADRGNLPKMRSCRFKSISVAAGLCAELPHWALSR